MKGYTAIYGGDPGLSGIYLDGEHVVDYSDMCRIGAQAGPARIKEG